MICLFNVCMGSILYQKIFYADDPVIYISDGPQKHVKLLGLFSDEQTS